MDLLWVKKALPDDICKVGMNGGIIAFHGRLDKGQERAIHWGAQIKCISMYLDMFLEQRTVYMKCVLDYRPLNYTLSVIVNYGDWERGESDVIFTGLNTF